MIDQIQLNYGVLLSISSNIVYSHGLWVYIHIGLRTKHIIGAVLHCHQKCGSVYRVREYSRLH